MLLAIEPLLPRPRIKYLMPSSIWTKDNPPTFSSRFISVYLTMGPAISCGNSTYKSAEVDDMVSAFTLPRYTSRGCSSWSGRCKANTQRQPQEIPQGERAKQQLRFSTKEVGVFEETKQTQIEHHREDEGTPGRVELSRWDSNPREQNNPPGWRRS